MSLSSPRPSSIFAARIDAMAQAAEAVEFLSFGTNDLTPDLPCSFVRDDARSFLGDYTAKGILPCSPFRAPVARIAAAHAALRRKATCEGEREGPGWQ